METLTSTSTYRHATLRIRTERATEFIDLTAQLEELVTEAGIDIGFVNVQTLHTTTGIVVNELEPLLLADFANLLERVAPRTGRYQHDDASVRTVNVSNDERINGHAHCQALLLPSSACIAVIGGALRLGRWQRVMLVELDGPRARDVAVLTVGKRWP